MYSCKGFSIFAIILKRKLENRSYIVDLRNKITDKTEMEYRLDDAYFESLGTPEVKKGCVNVFVSINKEIDSFIFRFKIRGQVIVPCDRCLDDMVQPVSSDEQITVKFGEEYSDEGEDLVVIPELEGVIDLSWIMYEFIALAIPMKHVHEDGECDAKMVDKLNEHFLVSDGEKTDPRWDALKAAFDNN